MAEFGIDRCGPGRVQVHSARRAPGHGLLFALPAGEAEIGPVTRSTCALARVGGLLGDNVEGFPVGGQPAIGPPVYVSLEVQELAVLQAAGIRTALHDLES